METTLFNQIVAHYDLDTSIISRIDEFKYVYLVVFQKGHGKRPKFYSKKGISLGVEIKFPMEDYFKIYKLLEDIPEDHVELCYVKSLNNMREYLNFLQRTNRENNLKVESILCNLKKYDSILKKVFLIEDVYEVNIVNLTKVIEFLTWRSGGSDDGSLVTPEEIDKINENFFKYFNYSYQQFSTEEIQKSEKYLNQLFNKYESQKSNELADVLKCNFRTVNKNSSILSKVMYFYFETEGKSYEKLLPLFYKYLDNIYLRLSLENS